MDQESGNPGTEVADRPVRKVFTTRTGGVSRGPFASFNLADHVGDDPAAVTANRERFARSVDLAIDRIVWMEQLHTPTVTVVDGPSKEPVPATDALVTTTRGLALAVLTADCVPLLISDHDGGVIAAVHAGRIGARNGIIPRTVARMTDLGAQPGRLHVWMGAAASGVNYELPEPILADLESRLPGVRTRTATGTWGADLRIGISLQLAELGVTHIDADLRCTVADRSFFSYRREGTTGRQAGLIWMPGESP
ncbi:peptidoglycan editing factor PgeF [Corynebacterium sp. CCM 9185]|uniref:Purine nucleoside phosphorylase n=1 Tax=Corynebacterium marambiense TaxID=2765364 RepID=A0ABS0VVT2_9CORY|nr:peptidoglycan editing factor PgeF [Corynebacterium marambiense]MBI9000855.1 peptidoglycan editing factor PgeF [Corynebacterium marambiense]MCK7662877.1 peptidoglycan editing factor PgeF [Corynebacterium marambiense]